MPTITQAEIGAALLALMVLPRLYCNTLPPGSAALDNLIMGCVAAFFSYGAAVGQTHDALGPQTILLTASYFSASFGAHYGLDVVTKNSGGNQDGSVPSTPPTTPATILIRPPAPVETDGSKVEAPRFDPSINHDFEAIISGGGGV